jgi:hypothetical protein
MNTTESQAEPRFRLKLVPLLVVAALGWGVPIAGALLAFFSSKVIGTPSPRDRTCHGFMLSILASSSWRSSSSPP